MTGCSAGRAFRWIPPSRVASVGSAVSRGLSCRELAAILVVLSIAGGADRCAAETFQPEDGWRPDPVPAANAWATPQTRPAGSPASGQPLGSAIAGQNAGQNAGHEDTAVRGGGRTAANVLQQPLAGGGRRLPPAAAASPGGGAGFLRAPKTAAKRAPVVMQVASSLCIVIGLFLGLLWLQRRFRPSAGRNVPPEVIELLGDFRLAARLDGCIVRFGNKILALRLSGAKAEVLAEIADPTEVHRMTELCLHAAGPARRVERDQSLETLANQLISQRSAR